MGRSRTYNWHCLSSTNIGQKCWISLVTDCNGYKAVYTLWPLLVCAMSKRYAYIAKQCITDGVI